MAYRPYIMVVTNDRFELPMTPPMHLEELAKTFGVRATSICHYFEYPAKKRIGKYKFIKLDFDVEEVEVE